MLQQEFNYRSLMVRDESGRYRPASGDEIIEAAISEINRRFARGVVIDSVRQSQTFVNLRLAPGAGAGARRARHAGIGRARLPVRRLDGCSGGRAEAQGEALGAAGRRAVVAVSVFGDARPIRARRSAGGRRPARALGDLGLDVQGPERLRGRDLELPEPPDRRRRSRSAARSSSRPTSWAMGWRSS